MRGGPSMGVPQNGWFIMGNPIQMDDLRVSPILENLHVFPRSGLHVRSNSKRLTKLGSVLTAVCISVAGNC